MSKHENWNRVPPAWEHYRRDDIARIAELEAENKRLVPYTHAILFSVGVGILSALAGAGVMFLFRG